MRIYTRSGDKGETSLIYGQRVPKDDLRVEAYGTCDEANSAIGLALSHLKHEEWEGKAAFMEDMQKIQTVLFHVGAELATPKGKDVMWELKKSHIDDMEKAIDSWDQELPPLKNFILPSGHETSAGLHLARTVVRRAERSAVGLGDQVGNPMVVTYLNRLSDLLFVAARYVNKQVGGKETPLNPDV
ncbi:cob(I)yrinic acid a,c-diamide adenosyltransferase [Halobacillus litoralis]|uniref:cob(I)yrinic acid a,c-diamide adenosyltransferase n=1 Tax=Halobacillus litoralis TaxID=45668 RepID=UPI001CD1ACD9|nr:cob(I)yrinic acid a,c-diamide adenosyltransferase [Halobacillus litoralis]MCA0971798.1 cob(I)yrinic acid a,c-diamide adenosyltransferase [Halobacillus litoralis]